MFTAFTVFTVFTREHEHYFFSSRKMVFDQEIGSLLGKSKLPTMLK
jgi:hypothetical protein